MTQAVKETVLTNWACQIGKGDFITTKWAIDNGTGDSFAARKRDPAIDPNQENVIGKSRGGQKQHREEK